MKQNKTVVITGASSGIGKAAAIKLKELGHTVVLVGRSPEKTRALGKELDADCFVSDFSSLDSVRKLGKSLHEKYPVIDVLFNNAGGIFRKSREVTEDGYEMTFQVCHLAHFLLTGMLFSNLEAGKATVINTSSLGARLFAKPDFDDLNMEKRYSEATAYGNAKLDVTLFTKEFDRRYADRGIFMASFHPGIVVTNFAADSDGTIKRLYSAALKSRFVQKAFNMIPPEKGADTAVWLATSTPYEDWQPGNYFCRRRVTKTHRLAYSKAAAESLWEQSEKMTGMIYPK